MKHIAIALLCLCSTLFAQQTPQIPGVSSNRVRTINSNAPFQGMPGQIQQQPQTLSENYALLLTITDKDAAPSEFSIAVGSPNFQAAFSDQGLNLTGTLSIDETGVAVIGYGLVWQTAVPSGKDSVQYVSSNLQGSVRLKMGEEIQIFRTGTKSGRLSIRKLEAAPAK